MASFVSFAAASSLLPLHNRYRSSRILLPVSLTSERKQHKWWRWNSKPKTGFNSSRFCPKAIALRSNMEVAAAGGVEIPASVPVRVANELLQAGHRYLDVRTPEEFMDGHPSGAINVPYMYRVNGSGMRKNNRFVEQVLLHFRTDDEIIVGCHSGKRSIMAAKDLVTAGFYGIVDLAGGYDAWSRNGLPTD